MKHKYSWVTFKCCNKYSGLKEVQLWNMNDAKGLLFYIISTHEKKRGRWEQKDVRLLIIIHKISDYDDSWVMRKIEFLLYSLNSSILTSYHPRKYVDDMVHLRAKFKVQSEMETMSRRRAHLLSSTNELRFIMNMKKRNSQR